VKGRRKWDDAKDMKSRQINKAPLLIDLSMWRENPWGIGRPAARKGGNSGLVTLELCAGGGGQALGLEQAGIGHVGLVELDTASCETLRLNRPKWNVINCDLNSFDGSEFAGADIVSAGLPCPPFSVAGKQLGERDDRNLFPAMIGVVDRVRPKAVMIENVRGILGAIFEDYRQNVAEELKKLGYQTGWRLMNASEFGVPQLRPRVVFVALRKEYAEHFTWPSSSSSSPPTVGDVLYDLIAAKEWKGAQAWRGRADEIAPTIVGGSHKHGGPDLGPTRAKRAWECLGVDAKGLANEPPDRDFVGMPRLTVRMVARLQGFPDDWEFAGAKTRAYRQVGNAFPPPFARAVAEKVRDCLSVRRSFKVAG
jgi:DNA (cytosine-5)-methyltransferase 1